MRFQPRCQMKFKIFLPTKKDFVAALSQKNGGKLKKRWNAWVFDLFIKKGPYVHSLKRLVWSQSLGLTNLYWIQLCCFGVGNSAKKVYLKTKTFSQRTFYTNNLLRVVHYLSKLAQGSENGIVSLLCVVPIRRKCPAQFSEISHRRFCFRFFWLCWEIDACASYVHTLYSMVWWRWIL